MALIGGLLALEKTANECDPCLVTDSYGIPDNYFGRSRDEFTTTDLNNLLARLEHHAQPAEHRAA